MFAQRLLAILFPEEPCVRQTRGEDLAVAIDDSRAAIGGDDVGGANEGVGKRALLCALRRALAADEVLLVDPRGELDHFGRHVEERLVKAAEQRHWPFGQPGVFDHQPLVGNHHQPGGMCGGHGMLTDEVLPLLMIDDDMRGAQLGGVVIRAVDLDRTGGVEAMAQRFAPGNHIAHFARHHFAIEQRDNRRKRTHPAQAFAAERGGAPALRLGPRESADDCRDRLGEHLGGGAAGLLGDRVKHPVPLSQLALAQPGLAQEPFERLRRRTDPRAFEFFADRSRRFGQIARDQRETARGGPDGYRAHTHSGSGQFLAKQLFQIGARASLHPRGDFLGTQFEQKVAHSTHSG